MFPATPIRSRKPSKPRFKMRTPPTQMTKERKLVYTDLPKSGVSIADICDMLAKQIQAQFPDKGYSSLTQKYLVDNFDKISIKEVKLGDSYYAAKKNRALFEFDESDGDFAKRMKRFADEIVEYNAWRKENAKEIARIEDRKKHKEQEKINRKQAALNRQMLSLQAKMSKLKAA